MASKSVGSQEKESRSLNHRFGKSNEWLSTGGAKIAINQGAT